jgi:hypothetical protein
MEVAPHQLAARWAKDLGGGSYGSFLQKNDIYIVINENFKLKFHGKTVQGDMRLFLLY